MSKNQLALWIILPPVVLIWMSVSCHEAGWSILAFLFGLSGLLFLIAVRRCLKGIL